MGAWLAFGDQLGAGGLTQLSGCEGSGHGEVSGSVLVQEGLLGIASVKEEQDHPGCDHSQELSGMRDPEITLARALAPKDCCGFSLYNAVHKAKTNQQQHFTE